MTYIGDKLPADTIVLTTGRDFKYNIDHFNEAMELEDFPAGSLFFEFADPALTHWTFVITGHAAALKIESTIVDLMLDRTEWQLVFLPTGEAAGGDVIALGKVYRQGRKI